MMKKFLAALLFVQIQMTMASETIEIPVYIDWQFEIQAPLEKSKFEEAVREYQKELTAEIPWYNPWRIYLYINRTNLNKS